MSFGPYTSFIVTSYAFAAFVVTLLIAWIAADHRRQQRSLRDLEASGVKRRSAQTTGKS